MKRKILYGSVLLFIVIQFVPVQLNQSALATENDFIKIESVPTELAIILKNSCYDCHSNFTRYPWYDRVAPISWWVKHHIDEGKDELNFSEWGTFSEKKRNHKLKEIIEEVEEGEMPLKSYLITHGDAKLSPEQFNELKSWINTIKR